MGSLVKSAVIAALACAALSAQPIHKAARQGDLSALRSLLAAGADPNQPDSAGNRPLAEAVDGRQLDTARLLLASGANPNLPSGGGRTPLLLAAIAGRIDLARLLLTAGADVNLANREGSPLEIAEREGFSDLAAFLRRSGARTSGRSVGDKVCVRPWKGEGYCGVVEAIDHGDYRIRVSELIGCLGGCSAIPACSAGKIVGGAAGLRSGDAVTTPSSCLTQTGVPQ